MKRFKLFIPFAIFALMSGLLYVGLSLEPNELPSVLIGKPMPEFALPETCYTKQLIQAGCPGCGSPLRLQL